MAITNVGVATPPSLGSPITPRPASTPIYPEATRGIGATNYQVSSVGDDKKETNEPLNFSNGYSIGSSIFWLQLLAGIVLGLILSGIDSSVLKTATVSVVAIVSLLYYLVEFFVVAYIPYNILKSNRSDSSEGPFWLTLFGVAIQSVIIASLFGLVVSLLIRSVINHGVSSSLTHFGGAGLGVIAVISYVGFFLASYFLTKLSWGITFSLFGKIKNKVIIRVIGIGVMAVFVGGIGYHYLSDKNVENNVKVKTVQATYRNNSNSSTGSTRVY